MSEPTREEVDRMAGPVVLEFGASWCPHCQAIQPQMTTLLARHSEVKHIPVEDGPGKPLGRSLPGQLMADSDLHAGRRGRGGAGATGARRNCDRVC